MARERTTKRKGARLNWSLFAVKAVEALPDLFEVRRFTLKCCIMKLKRAARFITNIWRRKKAIKQIQAAMKGFQERKHWDSFKGAALIIQTRYRCYSKMRDLAAIQNSASYLTAFWR